MQLPQFYFVALLLTGSFSGPLPLPFIGNIIDIFLADRQYPFKALSKLAQKYGDVLSVRLGSVDMGMSIIAIFSFLTYGEY